MKMKLDRYFYSSVLAALIAASVSGGAARADDGVDMNDDANKYLGPIYKDEVGGIKIAPPAGSRTINRAGGLEKVSFVNDAKQWGGNVQLIQLQKPGTVTQFMTTVADTLNKTFRGLQVLESRETMFGGRKAGRMALSMQSDLGAAVGKPGGGALVVLYRQQLIVQMSDTEFMVVTFYTPMKDQQDATATFNAMLSTFEIFDRATVLKERQAAVDAGKSWLAKRSAEELKPKLIHAPQLFRMKVGGKDVGYLQFDESEFTRDAADGVLISINFRSYPDDTSTIFGKNTAFWAYSKDKTGSTRPLYATWENASKTDLPRPGAGTTAGPAVLTFWLRETGDIQMEGMSRFTPEELAQLKKEREAMLRDNPKKIPNEIDSGNPTIHMHITYDGDRTQTFPGGGNGVIDQFIGLERPAVLPKVLEYTWTRVVDLTKPSEMTFVVYNSTAKKLTLRTLSVIGKDHIVIDKKGVDCIKCLDEMDPTSTTLWVDDTGKVLMMRTSDQSLILPTTAAAMEAMWGSRAMPR